MNSTDSGRQAEATVKRVWRKSARYRPRQQSWQASMCWKRPYAAAVKCQHSGKDLGFGWSLKAFCVFSQQEGRGRKRQPDQLLGPAFQPSQTGRQAGRLVAIGRMHTVSPAPSIGPDAWHRFCHHHHAVWHTVLMAPTRFRSLFLRSFYSG